MFGDLRDPMTDEEIEADSRQRAEEDRLWRASHPMTLKQFSASFSVSDAALRSARLQRLRKDMERLAAAQREKLDRLALLSLGIDPDG